MSATGQQPNIYRNLLPGRSSFQSAYGMPKTKDRQQRLGTGRRSKDPTPRHSLSSNFFPVKTTSHASQPKAQHLVNNDILIVSLMALSLCLVKASSLREHNNTSASQLVSSPHHQNAPYLYPLHRQITLACRKTQTACLCTGCKSNQRRVSFLNCS